MLVQVQPEGGYLGGGGGGATKRKQPLLEHISFILLSMV